MSKLLLSFMILGSLWSMTQDSNQSAQQALGQLQRLSPAPNTIPFMNQAQQPGQQIPTILKNQAVLEQCLSAENRLEFHRNLFRFSNYEEIDNMLTLMRREMLPLLKDVGKFIIEQQLQEALHQAATKYYERLVTYEKLSDTRKMQVQESIKIIISPNALENDKVEMYLLNQLEMIQDAKNGKSPLTYLKFAKNLRVFVTNVDYYLLKIQVYKELLGTIPNADINAKLEQALQAMLRLNIFANKLRMDTQHLSELLSRTSSIHCPANQFLMAIGMDYVQRPQQQTIMLPFMRPGARLNQVYDGAGYLIGRVDRQPVRAFDQYGHRIIVPPCPIPSAQVQIPQMRQPMPPHGFYPQQQPYPIMAGSMPMPGMGRVEPKNGESIGSKPEPIFPNPQQYPSPQQYQGEQPMAPSCSSCQPKKALAMPMPMQHPPVPYMNNNMHVMPGFVPIPGYRPQFPQTMMPPPRGGAPSPYIPFPRPMGQQPMVNTGMPPFQEPWPKDQNYVQPDMRGQAPFFNRPQSRPNQNSDETITQQEENPFDNLGYDFSKSDGVIEFTPDQYNAWVNQRKLPEITSET